jgi:hypothetical protein
MDLRKDWRNPALRALCAAITLVAVTATLAIPAVGRAVDTIVGVPSVAILGAHVCIVLFSGIVLGLLLFWSHPPEEARRKTRRLVPVFALTLLVLIVLFLLAPIEETTTSLAGRYALHPYVAEYLTVYLSAMAVALAAIVRLGWRYAKIAGRPWLRRGLRVTVAGAIAGIFFALCKGVYIVGLRTGVDLRLVEALTPLFASLTALLVTAGLTLPAWGPRLAEVAGALGRYRAYRRLTPLWRALYRAVPEIALVPPSPYADWLPPDVGFRLYRRVIEIRDGRLALRPYFDQGVAARARRLGESAGLSGPDLDAAVEASVLAAALRAKNDGKAVSAVQVDAPGGSDLSGEVAWLVSVATAFARSPVVAAVVAADASPNSSALPTSS